MDVIPSTQLNIWNVNMSGCNAPTITVGGVAISTSTFVNAQPLLNALGGADHGDPTFDEFNSNIAGGNNTANTKGIQTGNTPLATQSSLPGQNTATPISSDNNPPLGGSGIPVNCTLWTGDYDMQLSTNFKVRDFTVNSFFPHPLIDFNGLTAAQRCCNLQALAINVAEPLFAKFGKFRVNSAIRNEETCRPPNKSQHPAGMAMDVQFIGWNLDKYWENAAWIKDNIPYDQFIYEYSGNSGQVWYHLSFNQSGNRIASDNLKVLTMWQNKYNPGLQRYA